MANAFFIFVTILNLSLLNSLNEINIDYLFILQLSIYLFLFVSYIKKYRSKDIISFEFFFSLALFIAIFFYNLIFQFINEASLQRFFQFSSYYIKKGLLIGVLGYNFFIWGAHINNRKMKSKNSTKSAIYEYDYSVIGLLMNIITIIAIITSITTEEYQSLLAYHKNVDSLDNHVSFYITILIIISSVVEFLRLHTSGVANFIDFLKHTRKVYILNFLFIVLAFLLTGNRQEAMFILLPIAFLYSFLIRRISLKAFITSLSFGALLMIIIGMTRGEMSEFSFNEINLYYATRDLAVANADLFFLIENTDAHGSAQLANTVYPILAFFPFSQGIFKGLTGYSGAEPSAVIATIFLTDNNYNSGMGTNIIGDLYYSGGMLIVIIGMLLLGLVVSSLYQYLFVFSRKNVWAILFYAILIGNSVYFARTEFFSIVRYLGFSILILWLVIQVSSFLSTKKLFGKTSD